MREGDIPLIALDTSTDPNVIEVVRFQKESEYNNQYVAISHVWSEGLGNPHENSLPLCQLERIQSLVNKVYADGSYIVPYWIDTICVPLEEEWKRLAIARMDRTYAEADVVLVLDNSLQRISSKQTDSTELSARIAHATWVTRLWTYQEGKLSRSLRIQLQDGSEAARDLLARPNQLEEVAKILDCEEHQDVLSQQNLLQLARAGAFYSTSARQSMEHYAKLPEQDNADEEDARLTAIMQLKEEERDLGHCRTWRKLLIEKGIQGPTEADLSLRASIFTSSVDPVERVARRAFSMIVGVSTGPIDNLKKQGETAGSFASSTSYRCMQGLPGKNHQPY